MIDQQYFNDARQVSVAPASLATAPAARVSNRYTFVPTHEIVGALGQGGWVPTQSRQARVRDPHREGFQTHEIRLRLARQIQTLDEYCVELVIVNAHDGSSAYLLHAGIFRRVCKNGLVVSDASFQAIRFTHRGLTPGAVVEASTQLVDAVPALADKIGRFKSATLSQAAQVEFAGRALALRYPSNPPVNPEALLVPRRLEDSGDDVWRVLNRVQERLVKGKTSDGHRTAAGRIRSVRALHGIRPAVGLNKELWQLAEEFALAE